MLFLINRRAFCIRCDFVSNQKYHICPHCKSAVVIKDKNPTTGKYD